MRRKKIPSHVQMYSSGPAFTPRHLVLLQRDSIWAISHQHRRVSMAVVASTMRHVCTTKCGCKTAGLYVDSMQLWDTHVALTREVILAAVLQTPNLESSAASLFHNQDLLGANLALFYGAFVGDVYTTLLKAHIQIAINIVNLSVAKQDAQAMIATWHENAASIARFLANTIVGLNYDVVHKMWEDHLECTLNEAVKIIGKDWVGSQAEYKTCLSRIKSLSKYLSKCIIASVYRS